MPKPTRRTNTGPLDDKKWDELLHTHIPDRQVDENLTRLGDDVSITHKARFFVERSNARNE
jgi:hypothetical protein